MRGFLSCFFPKQVQPIAFHTNNASCVLTADYAFYLYVLEVMGAKLPFNVMYKGMKFSDILELGKYDHPGCLYVLSGYMPKEDTFVFVKYKQYEMPSDMVCCICLGELDMMYETPYRFYSDKCFHDMHGSCVDECNKSHTWFPCCRGNCGNLIKTIHMDPISVIKTQVINNNWIDQEEIPVNKDDSPEEIYSQIKRLFNNSLFIPFCSKPYMATTKQYHPFWSKN